MNKIISFSLWGNDAKYTQGAILNASLARTIYPGWDAWFYVGVDVAEETRKILSGMARVLEMPPGNWNSMFWRFHPADHKDSIMISRDTDSRLNLREKAAVDEWLAGDKDFHVMRDHPYHRTEILGGMWGSRNNILHDKISRKIWNYQKTDKYQVDQNFLREEIWPLVRDNVCTHDPFFAGVPFPTKRVGDEYVGQAFNADDTPCDPAVDSFVRFSI